MPYTKEQQQRRDNMTRVIHGYLDESEIPRREPQPVPLQPTARKLKPLNEIIDSMFLDPTMRGLAHLLVGVAKIVLVVGAIYALAIVFTQT